jgi:hypothetical protein
VGVSEEEDADAFGHGRKVVSSWAQRRIHGFLAPVHTGALIHGSTRSTRRAQDLFVAPLLGMTFVCDSA